MHTSTGTRDNHTSSSVPPFGCVAKQIQEFRDEEEVRCGVDGVGVCPGRVVVREQRALEFGERAGRVGREGEGWVETDAGVGEEDVEVGGLGVDPG